MTGGALSASRSGSLLVRTCRRASEALSRILSASPARLQAWVAETGDGLVGYATATLEFSTWAARDYLHMDCLFVCEHARGRNIGVALLDAVVDCARRHGVETIEWQTPDWNLDAARFYRRQGATQRHKFRFSLSIQA